MPFSKYNVWDIASVRSDGYFLLPLELPYGSYYLKEIESSVPITYQANTNLVPFTINENSHFKKLDDGSLLLDVFFENKRNLGTVKEASSNVKKYFWLEAICPKALDSSFR